MIRVTLALALLYLSLPTLALAQETDASKKQKDFSITPEAYIQLDFRGFPQWRIQPGVGRLDHENVEVRRLRGGIDGKWKRLSFEVKVDPQDDDGIFVKDAYAEFRLNKSVRFLGGQLKLPGSREYLVSAKNNDFLERTAFAEHLAAGRDIGGVMEGRLHKRIDYQVGLFAGDGNGRRARAGLTSAGRVLWKPKKALEVGTSFTEGSIRSVRDDQPENGLIGRMPSGYQFFDRLYEQGRRLRTGADVEWNLGAWRITAEGMRVRDERLKQGLDFEDLPSLIARGWSVGTRWRFGKQRFLGARYEWIRFNDAGPETGRDSVRPRASDVRAKAAHAVTLGLSWKPHPMLRFMGNAGMERYSEPRSAPEAGRIGNYYTLGSRIQFEWP